MSLNEIFKVRRFCIYCRASEEFCTCNNEIKFAVWEHAIKQDVKEAVEGAEKDLREEHGIQKIQDNLNKSFKGTFRSAMKNGYDSDTHYVIVDWKFFHELLKKLEIDKIWEKRFGEFK